MAPSGRQLDLLRDWEPPAATVQYDTALVRAATLPARLCRAVALTLKECSQPREEIAGRMSDFLGDKVSVNMLNAYASQARDQHQISLTRFIALLHATQDRRLLQLVAEQLDWAVIERRHLPLIELAVVQDRQEVLRVRAAELRQKAKIRGAL